MRTNFLMVPTVVLSLLLFYLFTFIRAIGTGGTNIRRSTSTSSSSSSSSSSGGGSGGDSIAKSGADNQESNHRIIGRLNRASEARSQQAKSTNPSNVPQDDEYLSSIYTNSDAASPTNQPVFTPTSSTSSSLVAISDPGGQATTFSRLSGKRQRYRRQLLDGDERVRPQPAAPGGTDCSQGSGPAAAESAPPAVFGLRCDQGAEVSDGILVVKANEPTEIILIGRNLNSNISIALTTEENVAQADCTHADRVRTLNFKNISSNLAQVLIDAPAQPDKRPYYLCLRDPKDRWYHQGSDAWLKLQVKEDFLPLYMKLIVIAYLLMLSGLFSGLNLGLMALDKNELQVIISCGSDTEKRYARAIEPVRRRGNYLLCSILFSNVLVNSTIAVLLEELTSGIVAVMTSTIFIVMFGEILPQAFCSRHGLAVGAKTVSITYFCMIVTFPLSYPVSSCLDWILGEEIGHAYDRERLMEFIRVTRDYNNLETDEVNIISGALKLKRIPLSEVMTRIEDVYMLDVTACLDFDTIQAIIERGYSRIPVHEAGNKKNIVALLFAKDLALLDPDDRIPVQTMISFYNHPIMYLFEDTTLDLALNEFKTGKSHMAFIRRVLDDGDRDPVYEITGIVTLEDVIEEIMQMEINDETDTLSDNRRKRRRKEAQVRQDFSQFAKLGAGDLGCNIVTPQLCLVAYQYLATTVEPFSAKYISDSILKRLLSQKIYYKVRIDEDGGGGGGGGGDYGDTGGPAEGTCASTTAATTTTTTATTARRKRSERHLYTAGVAADYFIMILEGRVHVICGKESLVFDGGPFSFFGTAALSAPSGGGFMGPKSAALAALGAAEGASDNCSPVIAAGLQQAQQSSLQEAKRRDSTTRQMVAAFERKEAAAANGQVAPIAMKRLEQQTLEADKTTAASEASQQQQSVASFSVTSTPTSRGLKTSASRASLQSLFSADGQLQQQQQSQQQQQQQQQQQSYHLIPDYTVEIVATTSYLKITRAEYLSALRATCVERGTALEEEQEEGAGQDDNRDEGDDAGDPSRRLLASTTRGKVQ